MLRSIFLFSFVLGAFAANSANQFVDNVLQTSLGRELVSAGLSPARLTNFKAYFGPSGIYQNQGEADFSFGNATGLDRIRRKGDCSGPRNIRGEISINCTLSLYPIVTAYKTIVRNGSHIYIVRNQGHVAETLISLEIIGRPQSYIGSVKRFNVDRLGLITPTFSQLPSQLNKYVKVLQDVYKANVSSELFNILQQRYVSAVSRAFAGKPMPRQ
ncbi:uncharacterized protein LOC129960776 [Argiope bruennichi]|uniref:Uncharacterized protein n=1 Tax=Argiope bruennichi TaxID=94029 RepID=A0A8T0FK68_ARGBR|nr:uncharacterized protein LOC129960776 [Argiope bruennichi]KAF8791624.1 hypothetical protein HNY73_006465 [Argiope bruennichi]